jgi:hypothetical protein
LDVVEVVVKAVARGSTYKFSLAIWWHYYVEDQQSILFKESANCRYVLTTDNTGIFKTDP